MSVRKKIVRYGFFAGILCTLAAPVYMGFKEKEFEDYREAELEKEESAAWRNTFLIFGSGIRVIGASLLAGFKNREEID